jgi:uncharacterized protein
MTETNPTDVERRLDIDSRLLELLCCPLSKGPLAFARERSELVSASARLAYPVRDGIPIMLPSEARPLEDGELPMQKR